MVITDKELLEKYKSMVSFLSGRGIVFPMTDLANQFTKDPIYKTQESQGAVSKIAR